MTTLTITGSKVIIREKRLSDARNDYAWAKDPELAQLDASPVVTCTFLEYLEDYKGEFRYYLPTSHRFAIETLDGKHIGNCSYYNANETRGESEIGIMIGNRDYWNKGYGTDVINTLVNYIFNKPNFKRIYLKTLKSNSRAQKCFKKCGFSIYGYTVSDGYNFALMEQFRNECAERQTSASPDK